ncbi:cyanase [Alkalihalobacterium alkalinitrilicum]|uniref:cyanase n=1 Tax=Alkalihalobacterium alkalinitrilicum TaxID=427920 RepID=UPI000994EF0E|nr:cyanase [Alkalihalobacterium alkalinitrilicum]
MYEDNKYFEYRSQINNQLHPIPSFNLNREAATQILLTAKKTLQLSFEQIADQIGGSKEWIAAVILGQESMTREDAVLLTNFLRVNPEIATILQEPPMRGSLNRTLPVDPLIYRFYEITQVYGTTLKALINEMFGDGIMSAIDLEIHVDKRPDPEDPDGERVVLTLDGKFLPYKKW